MASSSAQAQPSKEEIVQHFQEMRADLQQLVSKVSELESDRNEHNLVLETLATLDPNRKCFRLIGGILVERTVEEVIPGLTSTRNGITQIIGTLTEQYKQKEKELVEFQKKFGIQIKSPGPSASSNSERKSQGVLA